MYLYYLVIFFCLQYTLAEDKPKEEKKEDAPKHCPKNAGLKKILDDVVLDVGLSELQGSWMEVMITKKRATEDFIASYSFLDIEDDNEDEISASVKDYYKENVAFFFQTVKKKADGTKGVYKWSGMYKDGNTFNRDAYFYHVDDNVLGVYFCDPEKSLEDGWSAKIFVNGKKKSDIQVSTENDVKKAYKAAQDKLNSIKTKGEEWKKKNNEKFGLLGEMTETDLSKLETE